VYPAGYSFFVSSTTLQGWSRLDNAVNATLMSTFMYSRPYEGAYRTTTIIRGGGGKKPFNDTQTYEAATFFWGDAVVWAACSSVTSSNSLSISTRHALNSTDPSATGEVNYNPSTKLDSPLYAEYTLQWGICDYS
jgi:hypothetical protein